MFLILIGMDALAGSSPPKAIRRGSKRIGLENMSVPDFPCAKLLNRARISATSRTAVEPGKWALHIRRPQFQTHIIDLARRACDACALQSVGHGRKGR